MPEVPVQIADSLEHLELEANNPRGHMHRNGSHRGYHDTYATPPSSQGPGSRPMSEDRHSSYHSSIADDYLSRFDSHVEEPSYSPFPRLINPGPNIPPSDEEKEMQIESARMDVLSSNDPEMQLIWAQDALNYIEIAMNHYTRIADPPGRPQTPPLEHQIKTDAINVVSFLADQHHPRAEFMRGNWLEFGKFGFRTDKKEAFRCYARAAEKGYARAEYRMGMQFENSNEPQKAIQRYERGARAGDSASNYRLGMMTLLGQHGYKQDFARGCDLIRVAAETADENAPQGAYVYGMLLARELPGIDVPEGYLPVDLHLAKEMIEKAAFLGFARAQLKMGTAYELCQLSCDFDPAMSLHYNALAARQGEAEADMAISKWFLCGHEGVFDKNEELAYVYAKRAAASGLGTAEFAIGYFYEIGMYVQVDLKEAQRWYAKAAEHGNKDASGRIDGISRSKTLSRKDHENVAISKIKARHGSMRKSNPLTARRPPMPVPIEEVDMPEPIIPSGGQYNYPQGPPPSQEPRMHPVRQGSIPPLNTNFIRTDNSHGMPHGAQSTIVPPRSGTALPYPDGGRPGSSNGLIPGNQAALE
ncbi:HCP-like protein [Wilcoxina mikolae CBS 423.85]|nr:HCP-like protein [Wilcoxina mikolae CBS 423.85]